MVIVKWCSPILNGTVHSCPGSAFSPFSRQPLARKAYTCIHTVGKCSSLLCHLRSLTGHFPVFRACATRETRDKTERVSRTGW